MPFDTEVNYYTESFVGNSVDVASQVQDFCQEMYSQYPDTFSVISTNMIGTLASATSVVLYTA